MPCLIGDIQGRLVSVEVSRSTFIIFCKMAIRDSSPGSFIAINEMFRYMIDRDIFPTEDSVLSYITKHLK